MRGFPEIWGSIGVIGTYIYIYIGFRVQGLGDFSKVGLPAWGLGFRDYSILGYILGSPALGKLPCEG